MKKILLFLAFSGMLLFSCNGPDQQKGKDSTTTPIPLQPKVDTTAVPVYAIPHYIAPNPDTIRAMRGNGYVRHFTSTSEPFRPKPKLVCSGIVHVIAPTSGQYYFDANTDPTQFLPGDTLKVDGNQPWQYFQLDNVHGTSTCVTQVVNINRQVSFRGTSTRVTLNNVRFLHMHGDYVPGVQFGFYAADSTAKSSEDDVQGAGFQIIGRSNDVELDHFASYRKTYMLIAKQDPSCADSLNWPAYHMNNLVFHDGRADTTWQDVMYIGNTSPTAARPKTCGGVTSYPVPLRMSNVEVYRIHINWAWRTGIQTSGVDSGSSRIHDCYVYNVGFEYNQQQGYGFANGGMSGGVMFDHDTAICTFLYGFGDLGVNKNWVLHNYFDSSGFLHFQPGTNMDSLLLYVDSFNFNRYGFHTVLTYSGNYLQNTWSAPSSILVDTRSTLNSQTGVTVNNQGIGSDSSTIYIAFNKLGVNMGGSNVWVYETLKTYNYNASIIGCNTRIDGVTPAIIDTRHLHEPAFANFVYTTNCANIPTWGGGAPPPPPPPPGPVQWLKRNKAHTIFWWNI